jgi:hypothetical protein
MRDRGWLFEWKLIDNSFEESLWNGRRGFFVDHSRLRPPAALRRIVSPLDPGHLARADFADREGGFIHRRLKFK